MIGEVGEAEEVIRDIPERIEHINFGYPDTVLALLTGFDLTEISPLTGEIVEITIDSPSEFVGIICRINEHQILPLTGEITIRQTVTYPIHKPVKRGDRLVVALDNHDPGFPHTPSIVWQVKGVDR